jgi:hypothetical protein
MQGSAAESVSAEELLDVLDDFESLASIVQITQKQGAPMYFSPDRWFDEQRLFQERRTGLDIVLKGRQIGFSTFEMVRDLQFALTHPGTQTLIVGQETDLANKLFLQLRTMWLSLREQGGMPSTRYDNIRELYFDGLQSSIRVVEAGASREAARKKGRSGTIHRLHATEVAFWSYPAEAMSGLMNAVPSTGEIVIESTPNGAFGMFYQLCKQAQSGAGRFRFHFYPWHMHAEYRSPLVPRFNPAPRDAIERSLRDEGCDDEQIQWWREQCDDPAKGVETASEEYPRDPESCFRTAGSPYIDPRHIERHRRDTREPVVVLPMLGVDVEVFEMPRPGVEYVVGGDVAEGIGEDNSAATVERTDTGAVVAYASSGSIEPGEFGLFLGELGSFYNGAMVAPERNNHGAATLWALMNTPSAQSGQVYNDARIYRHADGKPGWHTTKVTRPILFDDLASRVRADDDLQCPSRRLLSEAATLVKGSDGKPRAANKGNADGCKDDGFVSWAICGQVRQRRRAGRLQSFHIDDL